MPWPPKSDLDSLLASTIRISPDPAETGADQSRARRLQELTPLWEAWTEVYAGDDPPNLEELAYKLLWSFFESARAYFLILHQIYKLELGPANWYSEELVEIASRMRFHSLLSLAHSDADVCHFLLRHPQTIIYLLEKQSLAIEPGCMRLFSGLPDALPWDRQDADNGGLLGGIIPPSWLPDRDRTTETVESTSQVGNDDRREACRDAWVEEISSRSWLALRLLAVVPGTVVSPRQAARAVARADCLMEEGNDDLLLYHWTVLPCRWRYYLLRDCSYGTRETVAEALSKSWISYEKLKSLLYDGVETVAGIVRRRIQEYACSAQLPLAVIFEAMDKAGTVLLPTDVASATGLGSFVGLERASDEDYRRFQDVREQLDLSEPVLCSDEPGTRCSIARLQQVVEQCHSVSWDPSMPLDFGTVRSSEALESTRAWEHVFETFTDCLIFAKDEQLRFTYVNQATAGALGLPKEEIIGKTDAELNPNKEEVRLFNEGDLKVLKGELVRRGLQAERVRLQRLKVEEEVLTGADKRKRILATYKHLMYMPDGSLQLLGISHDITELRELRENLGEARGFLNTVLDNVADFVYVKDAESRFLHVNRAMVEACGLRSREELMGKTDHDVFPKRYADAWRQEEKRIIETGQPVLNNLCENETVHGHSKRLVSKFPVEREGKIVGIVGIGRDVTQLEQLREELDVLANMFDTIPQCVWLKDSLGRYIMCNRAFANRHGYDDPREVIGKTDFNHWPEEEAKRYRDVDAAVMESMEARLHFRETQYWPDGRVSELLTSKIPLRKRNGDVVLLGIYEDITDRLADMRDDVRQSVEQSFELVFRSAR